MNVEDPLDKIKLGILGPNGIEEHQPIKFDIESDTDRRTLYASEVVSTEEMKYRLIILVNKRMPGQPAGITINAALGIVKCFESLPKSLQEELKHKHPICVTITDIVDFGAFAIAKLFQYINDPLDVIEEMKRFSPRVNTLIGFYLDRETDHNGTTGWDLLDGGTKRV